MSSMPLCALAKHYTEVGKHLINLLCRIFAFGSILRFELRVRLFGILTEHPDEAKKLSSISHEAVSPLNSEVTGLVNLKSAPMFFN